MKNHHEPLLLRAETRRPRRPREAQELQRIISRILPRSTLRILGNVVEITTFIKPTPEQLSQLQEVLGAKHIEVRKADNVLREEKDLFHLYYELLRENRFWEAHVVAEKIWRRGLSIGKQLAALAGAYAKAQEGLVDAALSIIDRVVESEELRRVIDPLCLRRELINTYESGRGTPHKCLAIGLLLEIR